MSDSSISQDNAARPGLRAVIPNMLTIGRLALAGCFVVVLSLYSFQNGPAWALPVAAGLFIVAAITDALDGFLARRWGVVSLFGRVMDPFADKVLVLSAFILLAGPGFQAPSGQAVSGVEPWMVVLILARELLVTSIRSVLEASGVSFGASWAGKLKMILQSIAVPLILLIVWRSPAENLETGGTRIVILTLVWATVVATVASAWPYVRRGLRAAKSHGETLS